MSKELQKRGDRTKEQIALDRVKPLETYLMEREIVDFDILTVKHISGEQSVSGRQALTLNGDVVAAIAQAWETNKVAITALISARIKPLLIEAALTAEPQEVMVVRQSIKELCSVLDDFEALHLEQVRRSQAQNQPEGTPAGEEAQDKPV